MRRADHVDGQVFHLGDRFAYAAFEGAHDAVEVERELTLKIGNFVVEQPVAAEVRPESIAGKEDALFHQVGKHGVRPVQVGRQKEAQSPAAQIDFVAVGDNLRLQRPVENLPQKVVAGASAEHDRLGITVEDVAKSAGMVGFGVVDHDVIEALHAEIVQLLQQLAGERCLDRIDENRFLRPAQQKRVVGRAVAGGEEFIENLQLRMLRTNPMYIWIGFQSRWPCHLLHRESEQ